MDDKEAKGIAWWVRVHLACVGEALGLIPSIAKGERRQMCRQKAECGVSMTNIRGIPKTGIVGSKGKQNLDFVTDCKLHLGKVSRIYSPIKGTLPGYP